MRTYGKVRGSTNSEANDNAAGVDNTKTSLCRGDTLQDSSNAKYDAAEHQAIFATPEVTKRVAKNGTEEASVGRYQFIEL